MLGFFHLTVFQLKRNQPEIHSNLDSSVLLINMLIKNHNNEVRKDYGDYNNRIHTILAKECPFVEWGIFSSKFWNVF